MMRILILAPLILLGGCISTVGKIVTAPVKIVSQGADWATTSQDEADRNRGRDIRKAEKRARKDCREGFDEDYAREQCIRERMRNDGY